MDAMTCPKCHGSMRSFERSGVTIDQCTECRGIFLDRGELERLSDAESNHYGSMGFKKYDDDDHRHYESHGHHKKKRSFLDELFD